MRGRCLSKGDTHSMERRLFKNRKGSFEFGTHCRVALNGKRRLLKGSAYFEGGSYMYSKEFLNRSQALIRKQRMFESTTCSSALLK